MKLLKKYKISPFEAALLLLLIVQFCLITYCNLTLIDSSIDCDSAKLYRHIIEMWRNKTIAIPNWRYSTTLEYDCTSLLALPLYGITKNIYLACGLSNTILTGIFIAAIFFLFSGNKILYPLLSANVICIPFGMGMLDYFNMMFFGGSQYIIKVLVPLILVGIILFKENPPKGIPKGVCTFFLILYFGLLLVTSVSSGSYVALCGLLPIFIVYLGNKFFKWEKVPSSIVFVLGASVVCIVLGIFLNTYLGGTRGSGMTVCDLTNLLANITGCIFGLFELFGGTTAMSGVTVLSYEGIVIVSRIFFTWLLLICGIIAIVKCIRKKADLRTLLLISVFVWNYIILNIAYTRAGSATFEYRYHLIGVIPLICVSCTILLDNLPALNKMQQKILCFCSYVILLFLCITAYQEVFAYGEQNPELKELAEYCETLDIDHAYMYKASNDSDICRVLDLETQYIFMDEEGVTFVYDYYDAYIDGAVQPLNSIVVVDNTKYNLGDSFTIPRYLLEKFAEVGNRSLYRFVLD